MKHTVELSEQDIGNLYQTFYEAYHHANVKALFIHDKMRDKYNDLPPYQSDDWYKLKESDKECEETQKRIKALWVKMFPDDEENIDNVFG